jgi:hypothetical protein
MRTKKINLMQIASHDFNRALRVLKHHFTESDILLRLSGERSKVLATALRAGAIALIGSLWLLANKTELLLKVSFIELSIPNYYVNFFVASSLTGFVLQLLNYFFLNRFVWIVSSKLFKFDSPWALTVMLDGGNVWSNSIVQQFRFLKLDSSHPRFGKLSVFLINVPMLTGLFVIVWAISITGWHVLDHDGVLSTGGILTLLSWLGVLASFLILLLTQVRFGFKKNATFIRWNFLFPLYRRLGGMPPRVSHWLEEGKAVARRTG